MIPPVVPAEDGQTCCVSCEMACVDSVSGTELKQIWLITLATTCNLGVPGPNPASQIPTSQTN